MTVKRRTAADRAAIGEAKHTTASTLPKSGKLLVQKSSVARPPQPSPPGVEDISKKGKVFDEFETGVILKLTLSHGMATRLRAVLAQEVKLREEASSSHKVGPNEMFARLLDAGINGYAKSFEKRAAKILKRPLPIKPVKPLSPGEKRRLVASREEAAAQLAQIIEISAALDAGKTELAKAFVQRTIERRRERVQVLDDQLAKDAALTEETP